MPLIKFADNRHSYFKESVFWTGDYSNVVNNGPICQFILNWFSKCNIKTLYYMPCSDGDITKESVKDFEELAKKDDAIFIVGTVAQRFFDIEHFLFLPQDDGIFKNGLRHYFPYDKLPKWNNRIPKVFWRGSCSADYKRGELLRRDVVKALVDCPYADVKLIRQWHENKDIPDHFFANKVNINTFLQHKYILIVDGNGISSSHTWVFASGAVPLLITNNEFWFRKYLIPFKNYVPIKYDLSDLKERIEWLLENEDKAQEIVSNSIEFADTVFSHEYQANYIETELTKIVQKYS